MNCDTFRYLTVGEIKLVIAGCIEVESEQLLHAFIAKLHEYNILNSEIYYVAIRLACKRKQSMIALKLLMEMQRYNDLITDDDSVNSILEVLLKDNHIEKAIEMMIDIYNGRYGDKIQCELSSYELLLERAIIYNHRVELQRTCQFLITNRHRIPSTNENMFMEALHIAALNEDFNAAMEIFITYESFHGIVQTRAYALLITTYLSSYNIVIHNETSSSSSQTSSSSSSPSSLSPSSTSTSMTTINKLDKLESVIDFIITSNIDNNSVIANLILRYFCKVHDTQLAYAYFHRIWDQFRHIPNTNTLYSYSEMLLNNKKDSEYDPYDGSSSSSSRSGSSNNNNNYNNDYRSSSTTTSSSSGSFDTVNTLLIADFNAFCMERKLLPFQGLLKYSIQTTRY